MFKINRKALAEELSLLQSVAEKKGTIPILQFVKVEFDGKIATLTATDCDVEIAAQIEVSGEPWAGCIPLRQLLDLSKLLGEETLQFKPNGRVEIRSGKSKHFLPLAKADDFPVMPPTMGDSFSLDSILFRQCLEKTLFCVDDKGDSRFSMQGINLSSKDNELRFVATNGKHAAVTRVPLKDSPPLNVTIPTRACLALSRLLIEGTSEITVNPNSIMVKAGDRVLRSRLVVGQFPDWETFVPVSRNHDVGCDSVDLATAIKRVQVTSQEMQLVRVNLKFTFSKDEILVESRGGEGEGLEPVIAESPTLNGDKVEIGMNGDHWLKFLAANGGEVRCGFNDPNSQIVLTRENDPTFVYVTMPVRL